MASMQPDIVVTNEFIRGLMLDSDVVNKRKIASFLRARYSLPYDQWNSFGGENQVLKDLAFCWLLKAYFLGAHESTVAYAALTAPDVVSKLNLLKDMYKDIDWVHRTIDEVYNGSDFAQYLQYLDLVNPGT